MAKGRFDIEAFKHDGSFLCPSCGSRNKKEPDFDPKSCSTCGVMWVKIDKKQFEYWREK